MAVPCQIPLVMVPVEVMDVRLPVVTTVPVALGKVMVLSTLGSATVIRVSMVLAVEPSKIIPVEAKLDCPVASAGLEARVDV